MKPAPENRRARYSAAGASGKIRRSRVYRRVVAVSCVRRSERRVAWCVAGGIRRGSDVWRGTAWRGEGEEGGIRALGVHAVFERFVVVGVAWVVECFAEAGCGHVGGLLLFWIV
jgi:hypothetical protein